MTIIIPVWLLWVLGFLFVYFTLAACALANKGEQLFALDQTIYYLSRAESSVENKDFEIAEANFKHQRKWKRRISKIYYSTFFMFPIILLDFYCLGVRAGVAAGEKFDFLEILLWPQTLIRCNCNIQYYLQHLNVSEQKILLEFNKAGISID